MTVIGKLDQRALDRVAIQFIESHAEPSAVIGQISRWHTKVCASVTGLQDAYSQHVVDRILSLADAIGAPAESIGTRCAANVDVIFSTEPQAQLDFIALKYRTLLGYYPMHKVKQATTFTGPVQVWYETGTRAADYQPPVQMPGSPGGTVADATAIFNTGLILDTPEATGEMGTAQGPTGFAGSRLTHGLRSEIVHVLIILDAKRVAGYTFTTISDYIALLALTRIGSLGTCSQLPSILNLFAKNCGSAPVALTASDAAYLNALYQSNNDSNLNLAQSDIRTHMEHEISRL